MNENDIIVLKQMVRESRAAQGLPPKIEDRRAVSRILRDIDALELSEPIIALAA